jgi:hypothetical protein
LCAAPVTLAFAAAAPCHFMSFRQGVRTPASQSKFPQKGTFRIKLVSKMRPRLVFSLSASGPVRQGREAGNPVKGIYWRWPRFNSDSRYGFSARIAAAANARGALHALGAEGADIVELGLLFGREHLVGPEHNVASVMNDDVEPTIFGNDLGQCSTNQRPRNDVKLNPAHGNPVRSFDGSIRAGVRGTGAVECERVGGAVLPGSIWPKTSDVHRG